MVDFFPIDNVFSFWLNRLEHGVLEQLQTEGIALSVIEGAEEHGKQLLVQVDGAVYVTNKNTRNDDPAAALIALLLDSNIEMCGPVRVKAIELLQR